MGTYATVPHSRIKRTLGHSSSCVRSRAAQPKEPGVAGETRTVMLVVGALLVLAPLLIGIVTYSLAILRILRTKSTEGTSATSLALSSISCLAWFTWAQGQGLVALAVVNAIWIPLLIVPELLAMYYVKPVRWNAWPLIPAYALVAIAAGSVSLLGGLDALGVLVAASGLMWLAPAVHALFLTSSPDGASAWAWAISGVSALTWGVYGVLEGAWVPVLYTSIQVAGISVALGRIYWCRRIRGRV